MKKSDITVRSANDNCWTHGVPAINVKWHPWLPDIIAKFENVTATGPLICKTCGQAKFYHPKPDHKFKPGGSYHVHDFGDDPEFWRYVHALDDGDWEDAWSYPHGPLCRAEEIAREIGWEDAKESAREIFGTHVEVYSSGRSGGWLVVHGLPDIEMWDAIAVSRWAGFERQIRWLVDDLDSQLIWHLYVNVWERERDQRYEFYRRLAS